MSVNHLQHCSFFHYSYEWKIRQVLALKEEEKYNLEQIELSNSHHVPKISFYTTKEGSNLNMCCEILRNPDRYELMKEGKFLVSFDMIHNECLIFRRISCLLKFDGSLTSWIGQTIYGKAEDLTKHIDLLFGPNDYMTVICRIIWFKDSLASQLFLSSHDMAEHVKSEYMSNFKVLFDNEKFSDVKLITTGGQELHAHKAVLAAQSPVFSTMFEHEMKEKNENIVEISDIGFDTLKKFIQYIYTGNFDDGLSLSAYELLPVADKYDVKGLKACCEEALVKQLTVGNSIHTLAYADRHSAENLKNMTKDFIAYKVKFIVETEGFKELGETNVDLLKELFSSFVTKIKSVEF